MLAFCLATSTQGAPILYGATGSGSGTGTLVTINLLTGAATTVGPLNDSLGQNYRITGLAFDPMSGVLYGSSNNQSPTNPGSLVTIDPSTAIVTFVGSFGIPAQTMADLTFAPNGTLYGWLEGNDDSLFTINKGTGQATLVGWSGISTYGSGLAANAQGVIYLAGQGVAGDFHVIDATTGVATYVATLIGSGLNGSNAIGAMAFSPSGTLYAAATALASCFPVPYGRSGSIRRRHPHCLPGARVTSPCLRLKEFCRPTQGSGLK